MPAPQTAAPAKPVAPKQVRRIEPASYLFRLSGPAPTIFTGPVNHRLILKTVDNILWPYRDGKPITIEEEFDPADTSVDWRSRTMRYIDGHPTIFKDEQQPDGREWDKDDPRLMNTNNYNKLTFFKRELRVDSFDKQLFYFLTYNSQCANRNPKARQFSRAATTFELIDFGQAEMSKVEKGLQRDKAYEIAKTARNEEMIPHARFLNIPLSYPDSDEQRDFDSIRADYVTAALNNTELFLKNYNDPSLKLLHWIKDLWDKAQITFDIVPGQAHWVATKKLICDLPAGEEPIKFLANFALTKEGESFQQQIKANLAVK